MTNVRKLQDHQERVGVGGDGLDIEVVEFIGPLSEASGA